MGFYSCDYYIAESGRSPVEEFIDSLDVKTQVKFFSNKKPLLEKYGPKLPYPHAKHLKDGIYELRFKGKRGQIRVLYFFFHRKQFVFTNGFIKKTQKTPRKEIRLAKERKTDFLERLKRGDKR